MRKRFKTWLAIYFLSKERPCAHCKAYSNCTQYIYSNTPDCHDLLFRVFMKEERMK